MKIGIPKETLAGERRVALTPDALPALKKLSLEILVEKDAGARASFSDADYEKAGARVTGNVFAEADLIVKLHRPTLTELDALREGSVLVAFLYAAINPDLVAKLAARQVTAFSMDAVPRI